MSTVHENELVFEEKHNTKVKLICGRLLRSYQEDDQLFDLLIHQADILFLLFPLKPCTPLEQEIASVLQNSSQMLEREGKELSLEEEKALKNMSLEEVREDTIILDWRIWDACHPLLPSKCHFYWSRKP